MKLDPALVREILFAIEDDDGDGTNWIELSIPDRSATEIAYHVMILSEGGFIDAQNLTSSDGLDYKAKRLTFKGHEFVAAARDDTAWNKTLVLLEKAGGFSLSIMVQMLIEDLKGRLSRGGI